MPRRPAATPATTAAAAVRAALAALAALPVLAAVPTPATAGPLGFSDPVVVGEQPATEVGAALGAGGTAALVAVGRGAGEHVEVARRHGAAGAWAAEVVAGGLVDARSPQAAVTPAGVVVAAWSERRPGGAGAVALLTARPGEAPRVRRHRVSSAGSASPRLAVLRSGAVLLAFRDARGGPGGTSRLRVARGAGAPRTVATRVAGFALTASGAGAHLAWVEPAGRRGAPRTSRVLRLGRAGRPIALFDGHDGRPLVVSRDTGPTIRLTGAPDGRALAAWTRPGDPGRAGAPFTRSLWPVAPRAARPVRLPAGHEEAGVPTLASASGGRAVVALRTLDERAVAFGVVSAVSRAGSTWVAARTHTAGSPMTSTPRPVLLRSGEALVVWADARREAGPARYDVVVARRAGDGPGSPGEAVGTGLRTSDGRGVGVAAAGGRVLVAWPAPDGGVALAERS